MHILRPSCASKTTANAEHLHDSSQSSSEQPKQSYWGLQPLALTHVSQQLTCKLAVWQPPPLHPQQAAYSPSTLCGAVLPRSRVANPRSPILTTPSPPLIKMLSDFKSLQVQPGKLMGPLRGCKP